MYIQIIYLEVVTANPCDNHVCDNGGTCKVENGVAKCSCDVGFEGETCQTGNVPLY